MAYVNKEMEKLFEEAAATYDIEVRQEKYAEVQELIAADSPYIIHFLSQKSQCLKIIEFKGIIPTASGHWLESEDWYIDEKLE